MQYRWEELADVLVNYSVGVKPGEKVLITMMEVDTAPLAQACYREVVKAGGLPFIEYQSVYLERDLMQYGGDLQLDWLNDMHMYGMDWADCYIGLRGASNPNEFAGLSGDRIARHKKVMGQISAARNSTRWVLSRVPNASFAQQARMPLETMMEFYFNACIVDWESQAAHLQKVQALLSAGGEVRIVGVDTDIRFSTKGRIYEAASGHMNMPDGEVFTCPLEDSADGHIYFEFPGVYAGAAIPGIRLTFEKGKLVDFSSDSDQELLASILHMDEGASTLGEFGIGLNYGITDFCYDILFDEKIGGTIHLAMGRSYPECGGVNQSALHWDIVKDTRKDAQIYLDGALVFQDGVWKV